mgnify:CR=1 FL=1
MANYNFLGLVNDINKKLNEVKLTSTNFDDALGFYDDAKNAVNNAIRTINLAEYNWPHNHVTKSLVLTPDVVRYDYELDAKTVSFSTFRIRGSEAYNNRTTSLWPLDYEQYLSDYSAMEYQPERYHSIPTMVFRTPSLQFGVLPPPDKTYTLDYEYYVLPIDLENHDDVPTIPENCRYVIFNGAMVEAYLFRGDIEASQLAQEKFEQGIKDMRKMYINRHEYTRSTAIIR